MAYKHRQEKLRAEQKADNTRVNRKPNISKLPSGMEAESDRSYAKADELDRYYSEAMRGKRKSDFFGREMNRIHTSHKIAEGNRLRDAAQDEEKKTASRMKRVGVSNKKR